MKTRTAFNGVSPPLFPMTAVSGSEAASMVAVAATPQPELTATYPAARLPVKTIASSKSRRRLDDLAIFKEPIVALLGTRELRVSGDLNPTM
jgi:hypothetical protein